MCDSIQQGNQFALSKVEKRSDSIAAQHVYQLDELAYGNRVASM